MNLEVHPWTTRHAAGVVTYNIGRYSRRHGATVGDGQAARPVHRRVARRSVGRSKPMKRGP